jgi:hypothetical protein
MGDCLQEVSFEVTPIDVTFELDDIEVLLAPIGEKGDKGDPGTPGADGDKFFRFDQASPASSWVVVHNLNKYPSVTVVDSAGSPAIGTVAYDTLNQLTIDFDGAAFSGRAYLN